MLDAARERGLAAVVVRPLILGRVQRRWFPTGSSIAGRWIVAGRGDRNLPLVYRDDVVDGLLAAAERQEAPGKVVNLVGSDARPE